MYNPFHKSMLNTFKKITLFYIHFIDRFQIFHVYKIVMCPSCYSSNCNLPCKPTVKILFLLFQFHLNKNNLRNEKSD